MAWTHWACDVTFGDLCFVPVELSASGDIESIVYGMNLVTNRCPGELVAVLHDGGQEAVEAWLADPINKARLDAASGSPAPRTRTPEDEA